MAEKIKDAKEKLGEDKYTEIIEKDWKVAELPSEEELAKEETTNPKARNNKNSRQNLAQYKKKTPEQKEKILSNLKYKETQPDVDPNDYLKDHPKLDLILSYLPYKKVFTDREEQEEYFSYLKAILSDFDPLELSASDVDDIVMLAKNSIFENRLFKLSSTDPSRLLDCSATIDKYRKASDSIKKNLANRRVDRVDPRKKTGISIVDLVDYLDAQKELDFKDRMAKLEEERSNYKPANRDLNGKLITNE